MRKILLLLAANFFFLSSSYAQNEHWFGVKGLYTVGHYENDFINLNTFEGGGIGLYIKSSSFLYLQPELVLQKGIADQLISESDDDSWAYIQKINYESVQIPLTLVIDLTTYHLQGGFAPELLIIHQNTPSPYIINQFNYSVIGEIGFSAKRIDVDANFLLPIENHPYNYAMGISIGYRFAAVDFPFLQNARIGFNPPKVFKKNRK